VFEQLTANEIELLNSFLLLSSSSQKELKDYMRYLLCKQYKKDVMASIFNNQLLHTLIHSLLHLVERDDFDLGQVEKRMKQIHELYFGLFEQVHHRYAEIITDLDSHEMVKDFGKSNCDNINRACKTGNRALVRAEVVEFYEGYIKLAKKKDARKIVAV